MGITGVSELNSNPKKEAVAFKTEEYIEPGNMGRSLKNINFP